MRRSIQCTFKWLSRCNTRVQLGFVLLAAVGLPSFAYATITAPTIANNSFASTAVGGSLTQTVTLTLNSAETITSIVVQPGQPGATEYAIQSITGCKVDGVTQSASGAVCDISIKFTPQLPGNTVSPTFARNATLVFTDSNAFVFDYGLTGAATGPVAKVVPGKVSLYAGVAATGLNALDLGLGLVTGGYGGDGGPATSATFNLTGVTAVNSLLTQPLALDSAGNLYVADAGNFIIRKIDNTSAHNVTTIAGTPTVTGTSTGSGGLATSSTLAYPHAITVDAAGNIFFIDAGSQYSSYSIVYRIDAVTKIITAIGGQLYNPSDDYNSAGGGTCVPDLGTPGYYECGDGGLATYASLPDVRNLSIDASGNLYLWEYGGYIRKIVPSTGIITTFATAADFPSDVAGTPSFALGGMTLASDGNFYVLVNAGSYELIYELNTTTQAVTQIAGGQQPNYTGNCDSSGSVNGKPSAPFVDIAAGQAGYPGAQLYIFTNGVVASTGDLASDASGNIYYSGAQCNGADVYDYRPAVFRINLPTDTAYLEAAGGSSGTATSNYGAYTGFNIAPASAIPDGNGNLYFTTNNQIGVISASAGALDFGQQNQFTTGITRIATYENVGNATDTDPTYSLETGLDFTDVSSTDTNACNLLTQVGVNKTCNIDYEFTPIQPNNITDTINLAEATPGSNPGFGLTTDAQTVTLTGDATPEAQFLVTPASLSFDVVVGQSATKTFTVSNMEGGAALGLYGIYVYPSGVASPPTEYTLGGTCDPSASSFSVAAGSSCTITVTFTPTAVGPYPTTMTINNSVTNPEGATFTITGTGTPATITNPVFSSNVGTALAAQEVTVTIATAGTLNAIQVLTGGAANLDFTMASGGTCATGTAYTVGETCTVNVGFKPIYAGARNGAVLLTDSSGNILATTYLPGTGVGPQLVFSPGVFTRPLALSAATPNGVAVDDSGDVYVANFARTGVLKFPPIAGGYGTPVTVATGLPNALQLAVDGSGNVYIADGSTEVIKVPWNGSGYGTQTIISPTGLSNAYGVAVDALGNVYIADASSTENKVLMLAWTGSGYGAATTIGSGLKQPYAVAVDGGDNVYIADYGNNRVVKVPFTGGSYGTQTTVGSGLSFPQGVAVDANGDVYIADTGNSRIVEVPWTGSSYGTQFDLGNEQTQLSLLNPLSIAVDGSGNFYIVDNHSSDYFLDVVNVSAPPSFNFSPSGETTDIGSTSITSPMTAYVQNIGNASLTFTTPGSGSNPNYPVNFPVNSTATSLCASGTPLTEGASCNVSVNFTPTAAVSLTGDVVLTDNDLNVVNSTQSIPVSGTGAGASSAQAINFTQPTSPVTYSSGLTIPLVATGGASGNPVVFTIDGSSTGTGSISGNTLTVTGIGSLVIDANQAGNSTYSAAPQVQRTVVVNQALQTINFTQPTSPVTYSTGLTIPLVATGGASGNPVIFTIDGSSTGTGSITGSTLTVTGIGSLVIDANQAGNADYAAATQVQKTIVVSALTAQAINFTQPTSPVTYSSGLTIPLVATGGASGNPVVFTIDGSSTGTGSISGNTLTVTGIGSLVVDANQAGNSIYSAAPQVQRTVVVNQALQTISFTQPTSPVTYSSGLTIPLVATGGASGNPVVFTIDGSSTGTGSITGSTLTVTGIGNLLIDANQAGNSTYSAAPQVQRTVVVNALTADFSINATPSTQTVTGGSVATYNVTVASVNGDFSNAVTLSATGLPTGATAMFTPGTVTPGSESAPSVMTIQTTTALAQTHAPPIQERWSWMSAVTLAFCIPLLWWRRKNRQRLLATSLLCALLCAAVSMLTGCGGGYYAQAPSQTYSITVTGASGSIQHSTTVMLTVQ